MTCGAQHMRAGVYVALAGDYCVNQDNKADPMVLCSTAAPICDEGVSGRCIALPESATQAGGTAPPPDQGPSEWFSQICTYSACFAYCLLGV